MLEVRNVSKIYKVKLHVNRKRIFIKPQYEHIKAINNLSLSVKKGQIVGLLGVNGAGKTTAIKMFSTLLEPTTGEIYIDGLDSVKYHMDAKKKINMISGGDRSIYWRLSAYENMEYFGRLYALNGKQLKNRIESILKVVDLYDKKDVPVEKYSKGMKQRLQIARGLINDPDYIFLDEPSLGLDIVIAKELRLYIKKLAKEYNKGILLTTHYMYEAEELCDYVYVIDKGSIVAQGTINEIKNIYTGKYKYKVTVFSVDRVLEEELENYRMKNSDITINIDKEKNVIQTISERDIKMELLIMLEDTKTKLISLFQEETSLEDAVYEIVKTK